MTKHVERSALVPFSARQIYDVVNDIEAYPQFMAGCSGAKVLDRGDGWVEARLELAKAGMKHSFVTRNQLDPPHGMRLELVSGPFKHFLGYWQFQPLSESACKVTFTIDFDFSNPLLGLAAGRWLETVASEQVESLCQRARDVYRTAPQ